MKKLVLGAVLALSLGSPQAFAKDSSWLVDAAKKMVAESIVPWDEGYFYGYVLATMDNLDQDICLPEHTTNGEIVHTVAYSITRHKELYSLTPREVTRRALMLEYYCK